MDINNQKLTHEQLVAAADAEVNRVRPIAEKDHHRLNYHVMAPANWINDPNGLIQFKGVYHFFYQHHPFSVDWGPMHWGHATSQDLIHWEHQPIALAPSEPYDKGGCFSGSAIEHNGMLYLVYTGVAYRGEVNRANRENRIEVQCIATSRDGVNFVKHPKNPVIPAPPPDGSKDFRDPKVWKHGNLWYMVVGSTKDQIGKVLLYESADLIQWTYKGVVAESDGTQGYMWECPDLFPLGNKYVLIVSPMGLERRKTVYFLGEMDYDKGKFIPEYFGEMDYGIDYYAAQTLVDQQGRRIAIGWMDCWDVEMPTKMNGWAGALTIPRFLTLNEAGQLIIQPVPELKRLRSEPQHFKDVVVSPDSSGLLSSLQGDSLEIVAEFDLQSCNASEFGIKLRVSEDGKEETLIQYMTETNHLIMDRSKSDQVNNIRSSQCAVSIKPDNPIKLHIFLDRSSVEIFVNDGQRVMSNRIYSSPSSLGMDLYSKGGTVRLNSLEVWKMSSIWK